MNLLSGIRERFNPNYQPRKTEEEHAMNEQETFPQNTATSYSDPAVPFPTMSVTEPVSEITLNDTSQSVEKPSRKHADLQAIRDEFTKVFKKDIDSAYEAGRSSDSGVSDLRTKVHGLILKSNRFVSDVKVDLAIKAVELQANITRWSGVDLQKIKELEAELLVIEAIDNEVSSWATKTWDHTTWTRGTPVQGKVDSVVNDYSAEYARGMACTYGT